MLKLFSNAIATEAGQWAMWFQLPVFCGSLAALVSGMLFFGHALGAK